MAVVSTASPEVLLHAGAGGVGLAAGEYAHWLLTRPAATAGKPHKHHALRQLDVREALLSSRDGGAFAAGAGTGGRGPRPGPGPGPRARLQLRPGFAPGDWGWDCRDPRRRRSLSSCGASHSGWSPGMSLTSSSSTVLPAAELQTGWG